MLNVIINENKRDLMSFPFIRLQFPFKLEQKQLKIKQINVK